MQVIHQFQLKSSTPSSRVRKIPLISIGDNRVWIASGSDIHVLSAKVHFYTTFCSSYYHSRQEQKFHSPSSIHTPLPVCWHPSKQWWYGWLIRMDSFPFGMRRYISFCSTLLFSHSTSNRRTKSAFDLEFTNKTALKIWHCSIIIFGWLLEGTLLLLIHGYI